MQLILQSPLFPVVEDLCKSTLRAEAERPVVRKERVDIQVLDRLLDQIMTGKYSMLREQVRIDKVGLRHCERYFSGLDIKKITLSAQGGYSQQPY